MVLQLFGQPRCGRAETPVAITGGNSYTEDKWGGRIVAFQMTSEISASVPKNGLPLN